MNGTNVYHRRLKMEVLSHYCLGIVKCADPFKMHPDEEITDLDVLILDHINGDGSEDRRLHGGGTYRRVKNENYPLGFQVLCWNCNMKKQRVNNEGRKKKVSIAKR